MTTYKVIRFYFRDSDKRVTVKRGLTLKQAQDHCHDPETSSSTCTKAEGRARTKRFGPWFEGYTAER